MKLSAVIKRLQQAINEHGDVEIEAYNREGELRPVTGIDTCARQKGSKYTEVPYIDTEVYGE